MAKSPSQPPDDPKPKIADADFLFRDAPPAKSKPKAAPTTSGRPVSEPDHSYDLIGGEEEPEAAPVAPIPVAPVAPRKAKPSLDPAEIAPTGPPATVDQVWTRGAEWGGTLAALGIATVVLLTLVYMSMSASMLLAFFIFAAGCVVLFALCYPILITLERPVRITPEQAAKDYYAMLSHMMPHYRRMWLLLSSAGRDSREFSSFGEFQGYWKRTLASLQKGKPSTFNPLTFKVEDFHSEKSAGMTALNAKFTVKVYRGAPEAGVEVASYLIASGLVKGPDRMWYLNTGTLLNER